MRITHCIHPSQCSLVRFLPTVELLKVTDSYMVPVSALFATNAGARYNAGLLA